MDSNNIQITRDNVNSDGITEMYQALDRDYSVPAADEIVMPDPPTRMERVMRWVLIISVIYLSARIIPYLIRVATN